MRPIVSAALLLSLAACYLPKDPEGTTRAVEGATLKVGLIEDPLPRIDAAALDRIAQELGADLDQRSGNPHALLEDLSRGDLHILAGGIPTESPLADHAGKTNAIGHVTIGPDRPERVLLIRRGENRFLLRINKAVRPMTREARE